MIDFSTGDDDEHFNTQRLSKSRLRLSVARQLQQLDLESVASYLPKCVLGFLESTKVCRVRAEQKAEQFAEDE